MGRDPLTGGPLGRVYQQFASVAERIEEQTKKLSESLDPSYRSELVAQIEAEEKEHGTRKAVAAFDYTFSVPKSVSAIWAVADVGTQSLIAAAHHAAVTELVELIEQEVAATRVGATGHDGAIAQVDVLEVAATAFNHYDSRSHDPQLHTHVVISNKVKTTQDGKWRTLDSRPMHRAVVAISPALFRRADGSSRFRPYASTVFSSESLLEAEDRLLARADKTTAPTVSLATIETTTRKPDKKGLAWEAEHGKGSATRTRVLGAISRILEVWHCLIGQRTDQ